MSKRFAFVMWVVWSGLSFAFADTIQLKDKAAITGRILARKHDQVFVDVGYTVLVVPRNQIEKITESDSSGHIDKRTPTAAATNQSAINGLFQSAAVALPERSVRELVGQLGAAVVQVRTPSGLGSGFIINEEGYLITNFHVIENETQISVEVYHQKSGQLERKSYKHVKIIAINKFSDLALLKIEDQDAPSFAKVLLGDSEPKPVDLPGAFTFDASVLKTTTIKERHRVEFRAEFFNLFNHMNWTGLNTNLASSTFGKLTATLGSRQISFGIRYSF